MKSDRFYSRADDAGGVAVAVAILAPALILMIGAAIEYSKVVSARSELQNASDAAALHAARYSEYASPTRINRAKALFNTNLQNNKVFKSTNATIIISGATAEVNATANISTPLLSLLGSTQIEISVRSVAVGPEMRDFELALVLDVSGSMNTNGGAQALKAGVNRLIDRLAPEGSLNGGYISIVPYNGTVNVGVSRTAWLAGYSSISFQPDVWRGCIDARTAPADENDVSPSVSPFKAYYWPAGRMSGTESNVWPPIIYGASGPNLGCNPNKLVPLSNSVSRLRATIDALDFLNSAGGEGGGTNHPEGLVWGWRTLSPRWTGIWNDGTPGTRPSLYNNTKKYLVIMTDEEPSFPFNG